MKKIMIADDEPGIVEMIKAVSYTHLDVYKRQHLFRASVLKSPVYSE